ncbi:unnamed protein product [Pedinophyceae sp. YPF-701]|nr:unnamed protein product [Pedinophyceae sp. YPF-701]
MGDNEDPMNPWKAGKEAWDFKKKYEVRSWKDAVKVARLVLPPGWELWAFGAGIALLAVAPALLASAMAGVAIMIALSASLAVASIFLPIALMGLFFVSVAFTVPFGIIPFSFGIAALAAKAATAGAFVLAGAAGTRYLLSSAAFNESGEVVDVDAAPGSSGGSKRGPKVSQEERELAEERERQRKELEEFDELLKKREDFMKGS